MGSVGCEVENDPRNGILDSRSSYLSLKQASTVLIIGYQLSLNKALLNLLLRVDSSDWKGLSSSNREAYSKHGILIHELKLSFENAEKSRGNISGEYVDERAQSGAKAVELYINIISTPGLSSLEMEKARSVLEGLIETGTIDNICFVHTGDEGHNGSQYQHWDRWLNLVQQCASPANLFAVFFENSLTHSKIEDLVYSGDVRTFVLYSSRASRDGPRSQCGSAHSTAKLLQAIVLDKIPSNDYGQSSPQNRTLGESHITLYRTCQRVCDFLQIRVERAVKESSSMKSNIDVLQSLHTESTMLAETAENRITELDTSDLELMEPVTGLTSMFHQHRVWHVGTPPNFEFDVTTPFPIRDVIKDQGYKSSWVPQSVPHFGRSQFVAQVRNGLRSDAFAKVDLFGWRREVHGEELNDMRRIASEQKKTIAQLYESIESMTLQWSQAESVVENFEWQLADTRRDMELIVHCELQQWDFQHMRGHLKDYSLYGVGRAYGLKSSVQKSQFQSILGPSEDGAYTVFQQYDQRLGSVNQYFDAALEKLKELDEQSFSASDQQMISFETIQNLVTIQSQLTTTREQITRLKESSNLNERKIVETGLKVLQDLDEDMEGFCRSDSMCEVLKNDDEEVFKRSSALVSARDAINSVKLVVVKDHECTKVVLDMLASDAVEIAVLASLANQTNKTDAWWSIWRGLRMCDICLGKPAFEHTSRQHRNHLSTEF